MQWIAKIINWWRGPDFPVIGGPLHGHTLHHERFRHLYPEPSGVVHVYRFTTLRLSNEAALRCYVSETIDSESAVTMYEGHV